MKLPGAGNGEITGAQIVCPPVGREYDGTRFQKQNFDAFIPMWVFTPVLSTPGVPKTDAVQAG
ncbi:MAG TPA: hypothetical protein VMJ12_04510, partial [Candidatus Acidoferrales bacterium]|nr:hypothetical protein [Candidatus Acidoferrales bacterium]